MRVLRFQEGSKPLIPVLVLILIYMLIYPNHRVIAEQYEYDCQHPSSLLQSQIWQHRIFSMMFSDFRL